MEQNGNITGLISSSQKVSGFIKAGSSFSQILTATTEEWNSQPNRVSKKNTLYVYSDYRNDGEKDIPAIKVGDGLAYIIDLPFVDSGGVTPEQIDFWNNKVTAYVDEVDGEVLILSKN